MERKKLVSRHRRERKHILAKMERKLEKRVCAAVKEEAVQMEKSRAKEIWNQILEIMEENTTPVSFETWIEPCKALAFKENKLFLEVENGLYRDMLEKRYLSFMNEILKKVAHKEAEVVLVLEERK